MIRPDDQLLLDLVQQEVPIAERPYLAVGETLAWPEDRVIERLRDYMSSGVIRRLGVLYEASGLGYRSTLCAAEFDDSHVAELERQVMAIPEVTHCYLRSGRPRLWFTIVARSDERKAEIMSLMGEAAGGVTVHDLPARRFFKLHVRLPLAEGHGAAVKSNGRPRRPSGPLEFTAVDRSLIRETQESIPVTSRPFAEIGARVGLSGAEVVARLRGWQEAAVLRRIGAVLYHREVGFDWNGMCRFPVADEVEAEPIGAAVTGEPMASHGYLRISANSPMPSAVYAMVHGRSRDEVERAAARIASAAGVPDPEIWWTEREIKKTSMRYFAEDDAPRTADVAAAAGDLLRRAGAVQS